MRNGSEVRPKMWENVLDLYDDGDYSAIWGTREKRSRRSLGVRWNGESEETDVGYPNQGGNPLWYSEPIFLEHTILLSLLDKVNSSGVARKEEFTKNILTALQESKRHFQVTGT